MKYEIIHITYRRGFSFLVLLEEGSYKGEYEEFPYLYRCTASGRMEMPSHSTWIAGTAFSRKDRIATPRERQMLIKSLSKNYPTVVELCKKLKIPVPSMFYTLMLERILE